MRLNASATKKASVHVLESAVNARTEPSLFRRKMESAELATVAPANGAPRHESDRGYALPQSPSIRQYLFHLSTDARHIAEAEVRNAVVGVTPVEIERVARTLAKLRGRYLAQVVDAGAGAQGALTRGEVEQLRQARESYQELEAGFAALRAAIESGEIPLEGVRRD